MLFVKFTALSTPFSIKSKHCNAHLSSTCVVGLDILFVFFGFAEKIMHLLYAERDAMKMSSDLPVTCMKCLLAESC